MRHLKVARLLTLAVLGAAYAQTGAPAFEVASLKLSTGEHLGWSTGGGRSQRTFRDMPLKECIKIAFDVRDYSLDGPRWLDSVWLDIVAKPPEGSAPDQFNRMLQTLLVERFKMTFHKESRVMSAYALVEAKGGIKIGKVNNPEGGGACAGCYGSSDRMIWGDGATTARVADMLARQLDHPVQDLTGITKVFDFRIEWTPEKAPAITGAPGEAITAADPGPSLLTALQKQLGLKLEARKLPVDVMVIDHVERVPIAN